MLVDVIVGQKPSAYNVDVDEFVAKVMRLGLR